MGNASTHSSPEIQGENPGPRHMNYILISSLYCCPAFVALPRNIQCHSQPPFLAKWISLLSRAILHHFHLNERTTLVNSVTASWAGLILIESITKPHLMQVHKVFQFASHIKCYWMDFHFPTFLKCQLMNSFVQLHFCTVKFATIYLFIVHISILLQSRNPQHPM